MRHVDVGVAVVSIVGAIACTKPNPNYCADHPNNDCTLDARNTDGDSNGDDAQVPMGEVTVELLLGGAASSDRTVVFHESDGTIVSQTMTDAFGTATGVVRAGAMVTVAVDSSKLVTITSIAPGDHIVLKTARPFDQSLYGTVTFTASSEASGKSYYRTEVGGDNYVTTTNVTSGSDRTLDLKNGNRSASGLIDVVSSAYNASNQLVGYNYKIDLTPTQNGATNAMLGSWFTDIVSIQILLSGAPTDASLLTIDSYNERSGFLYAPSRFGGVDSTSVSGGGASVTVPYLGGYGDFVQTRAKLTFPPAAKTSFSWTRRATRPAGNFVIAAADMPPRLAAATLDSANPMRPSVHWTTSGGGDAILATMYWNGGSGGAYQWFAYTPPDTTSVTFPVVPTALSPQAPSQLSTLTAVQVSSHDLEPLTGYDEFRSALPVDISRPDDMPIGYTKWVRSETSN